jgi:hypothetical protein
MSKVLSRSTIILAALVASLLLSATPALAKSYSAERFDSVVRVLADGSLEVTETVVFRFEDGTFREVFREIPLRRTDGIDVVGAEMQGQQLPFGSESGTAEVERRSDRIRVIWRFSPIEGVRREFTLRYQVRGAVRQADQADLLVWRGIPGRHQYRIDETSIRFELPASLSGPPEISSRRAGSPRVSVSDSIVEVASADISSNGWIDTSLAFARGAFGATPPRWQQRDARIAAQSINWIVAAALVSGAGLILLFAWRQGYDGPPGDLDGSNRAVSHQQSVPDSLAPAVGGVLAANGRPRLEHAIAALFAIADREEVEIREQRGTFGQRHFTVTRRGKASLPAGYEQTVMDIIFKDRSGPAETVTLSQARTRLTWRFSRFAREMTRELAAAGLLDHSRKAIRERYNLAGITLLVLAGVSIVPAVLIVSDYGGWPVLIPAAVSLVAIASFIFGATTTPLSNDGVRRGARWREYRRHLAAVAKGREPASGISIAAVLPFAVALGLSESWSKFLKRQAHAAPRWFHALAPGDANAAFPAFIATGCAGASGGASGGGAGAAGGGSSGAS